MIALSQPYFYGLQDQVFVLFPVDHVLTIFETNPRNSMHATHNTDGSWDAYIRRKCQNGQDPNCFSPEELWEFDFLVEKIQRERPHLDQLTVTLAVREGMRRTVAPRLRDHFVQLVMNNIRERESRWSSLLESFGEGANISGAIRYPFIPN